VREAQVLGGGSNLFGRNRTRSVLTIAEIALAMILLAGAGLLMKSFLKLSTTDWGYNPENILTFWINLPQDHAIRDIRRRRSFTMSF